VNQLEGKVILITGATSGLGVTLAESMLDRNQRVIRDLGCAELLR
jgi:NADP-dependent 3-hydroxy acid dehydrogenase YdfG